MNKNIWPPTRYQVVALIAFIFVLVAMLLIPPFEFVTSRATMNLGYGFLFSPPRVSQHSGSVNLGLLILQILLATIVFGVMYLLLGLLRGREPRETASTRSNWVSLLIIGIIVFPLAILVWAQDPLASDDLLIFSAQLLGVWFWFMLFGAVFAFIYHLTQHFRGRDSDKLYWVWGAFSVSLACLTYLSA